MKRTCLRALLGVMGLIGLSAINSAQAAQVSWKMQFYDESFKRVGVGFFNYDDATTDLIALDELSFLFPNDEEARFFEVDHRINRFNLTLYGENVWLGGWEHWWFDDVNPMGYYTYHFSVGQTLYRDGSWMLEKGDYMDLEHGLGELSVTQRLTSNLWLGTWDYYQDGTYDIRDGYTPGPSGSGNVLFTRLGRSHAAPVPIPAALPLFAVGLLGLRFAARRKQLA